MKNKIVSILAAAALLFALVPAGAFAPAVNADESNVITFVELFGFHGPLIGETAEENISSICVFDDAPYTIKSLAWYTEVSGSNHMLTGSETFKESASYWLEITILPKSGYFFDYNDQPLFWINNSQNYVDTNWLMYIEPDGSLAFYSVELASEVAGGIIDELNIYGVFYPYQGESVGPSRNAIYIPNDCHCSIKSVTWSRYAHEGEDSSQTVGDSEVFQAGDTYWLYFIIEPDEDYFFDSYAVPDVYINESTDYVETSTVWVDNDGNLRLSSISFPVVDITSGVKIEEVNIKGFNRPQAGVSVGDNVAYLNTPTDAPYLLIYGRWDDGVVVLENDDVFEAGKTYSLSFYILPASGYCFESYGMSVLVNGSSDYAHGTYTIQPDGTLVCYTVDFYLDEGITYRLGDMDGDGDVDSNDSIYLLRHVLFEDEYYIIQSGDMDCDGDVDSDDSIYLLRHVLFPGDYPL